MSADPELAPDAAYSHARVFVRADLDVAYGNVVSVVDELKDSRFETVSIVAQDAGAG